MSRYTASSVQLGSCRPPSLSPEDLLTAKAERRHIHAIDSHDGTVVGSVELHSPVDVVEAIPAVTPVLATLGITKKHAVGVAVLARGVAHTPRGPIAAGVLAAISATIRYQTDR